MRINIIVEEEIKVDNLKLKEILNQNSSFLEFEVKISCLKITDELIIYPKTHLDLYEQLSEFERDSHLNFFFTYRPYDNNFFFESLENLVPVSLFGWDFLTNLPIENGILFFSINYLVRQLKNDDFRHEETTGCMYDFLWDKKGVDDGMRKASFCKNCLTEFEQQTLSQNEERLLNDLKTLMDLLASSSKWNQSILQKAKEKTEKSSLKRKTLNKGEINIIIASPSDLAEERELLLDKLERKFRLDKHEDLCKHRLKVHGWEDLPSQSGYAQDVINEKVLSKMDIVLAIFQHKLGSPTIDLQTGKERFQSGTAEEILYALDNKSNKGPLGMVYFFSTPPAPSLESENFEKIKSEWDRLKSFKNSIQNKVIYKPFTSKEELINEVSIDIMKNITELYEN